MKRMCLLSRAVAVVSVLASGVVSSAASRGAGFLWLGDLPGGKVTSLANAISSDGLTVVGQSESSNGLEGFRWTGATGMSGIGKPAGTTGSVYTNVSAVSGDGSLLVGAVRPLAVSDFEIQAFRWSEQTGVVCLDTLPGLVTPSRATAISDDGSVVAGYSAFGKTGFRWVAGGTAAPLPPYSASQVRDVSADGSILVGSADPQDAYPWAAVRWTAGGGAVDVLTSFAAGPNGSEAYAVSPDGSVVVGGGKADDSGLSRGIAFRWTKETGAVSLGTLPGAKYSVARAVSSDGSVVVGDNGQSEGGDVFLWDAKHGMRSLQSLLIEAGGFDMTNGQLLTATGISADGKTVVGSGSGPSGKSAWIATLHETRPAVFQKVVNGVIQPDGNTSSSDFGQVIVGTPIDKRDYRIRNVAPELGAGRAIATGDLRVYSSTASKPTVQFDLLAGTELELPVSLDTSTVGAKSGGVTVQSPANPLDLAEIIQFSGTVVDHANASFDASANRDGWTVNFNTIALGRGPQPHPLAPITNLIATPQYTAALDLDSLSGSGDTSLLTTNVVPFQNLPAGQSKVFDAFFAPDVLGDFSAKYRLAFSDQDIPGATSQTMSLWLIGRVRAGGDADADYDVDAFDVAAVQRMFGQTGPEVGWAQGDFDGDQDVDVFDVAMMQVNYSTSGGPAPVPEPATWVLAVLAAIGLAAWRVARNA